MRTRSQLTKMNWILEKDTLKVKSYRQYWGFTVYLYPLTAVSCRQGVSVDLRARGDADPPSAKWWLMAENHWRASKHHGVHFPIFKHVIFRHMHHTRGVLIRNFGRRQDPGLDALRLEIICYKLFFKDATQKSATLVLSRIRGFHIQL